MNEWMRHNDSIIIPHLISFYSTILLSMLYMGKSKCMRKVVSCENEESFDEKLLLAVMKNLNTFLKKKRIIVLKMIIVEKKKNCVEFKLILDA